VRLSDFRIKSRIYGGFGVLIVLGAAATSFDVWQLHTVGNKVDRFLIAADDRATLLEASGLVESLRHLGSEYQLTGEDRAKQQFAADANRAVSLLKTSPSTERQRYTDDIAAQLAAAQQQFGKLVELRDKAAGAALDDTLAKAAALTAAAQKSAGEQVHQAKSEADGSISGTGLMKVIAAIVGTVFSLVFAGLMGRSIALPVTAMTAVMKRLASGDRNVTIPARDHRDEIGGMAQAVEVFRQSMIDADRLAAEKSDADAARERRQRAIEEHLAAFDRSVRQSFETLSDASTQMRVTAQSMSATAEETSRQATGVASASEQASANVETVAAAAEEMGASIAEISRQVAESSKIATMAVQEAARTNVTVQGLAEAAQKIGEVVSLIQDIASQTNLLALNATIEAARAGEAGKGFAVVASEVKSLANQTAKATEDIGAQIGSIQSATKKAVDAIQAIDGTIGRMNEISAMIATAMEEQGASTREIARNTQEAARGTQEVSQSIGHVTQAAAESGSAASQVLTSSEELGRQAETLRAQVDQFLAGIRAA
jgi:methyl-accepting chemotaxis protein